MHIETADLTQDQAAIDALFDAGFGRDRRRKASYRVRDGVAPLAEMCCTARSAQGELIGAAMAWPAGLSCMLTGRLDIAVLFGPISVADTARGRQLGRALLSQVLDRLDAQIIAPVFLVGDRTLYREAGFLPVSPRTITLPGGADADRLKVRDIHAAAALPTVGELRPAHWVPAAIRKAV